MNYGYNRSTPWEKIFLYWPLMINEKIYWWVWAERRVKVEDGKASFEWRVA